MTETDLIKGCIKENAHCQRMLFEQYAGKMMSVCLRYANDTMEAEDIMQDGFIKVFQYLHQFKFEGSFEGWIRRIIVNTAIRHLEKKKIQVKDLGQWLSQQFKNRSQKTEKDKIYAALNWENIVLSSLKLGGISSYQEAQALIDKHA